MAYETGRKRKRKKPAESATEKLYNAVAAWLKSRGGLAVVVGGIKIIPWPQDALELGAEYRFSVAVDVTGRRPNGGRKQ